jgi:hypothetical protein
MTRTFLAAAAAALTAATSNAGWDNVFQVTCNDCRPRTSYSPPPCDQPEKRVDWVQRSYYQPVTEYKRESFYTPVEERVKSYYYEPITTYKYTTYYDPCTGCPQDVVVPQKSLKLREKCDTVTRWIESSKLVPYTAYKPVTMMQPVVTYYYAPRPSSTSNYTPGAPLIPAERFNAPQVEQFRDTPPTVVPERSNGGGEGDLIPKKDLPTAPGSMPRQMPPATKTNKVHMASRGPATLRGEVVLNDRSTPVADRKVIFVNPTKMDERVSVTTDSFGSFDAKLTEGEWYVYLGTGEGKALFHKKLTIDATDTRPLKVVSR